MSVPSLLTKGAIKPSKYIDVEDANHINNVRAIDYILKFISRRSASQGVAGKRTPKTMGDRVILLRSGTGSGKSTTVAPELYKTFAGKSGRNIIITQPRVLTAIDKAQDMCKVYPNLIMGYNVGYQTGARTYKPHARGITSMTTGILLNILTMSRRAVDFAKTYSFVIIDEIHEKDINTDTSLFLIKKFLKEYWDLPDCPFFIFMSATFDPKAYMDYFDIPPSNFIEVEGRAFPIVSHFPRYDVHDYLAYAIKLATRIHVENISDLKGANRDIIIFVKNRSDAQTIIDAIHVFNAEVLDKGFSHAVKYIKSMSQSDESAGRSGGAVDIPYILPVLLNKQSFTEGGTEYRNLFSEIQYLQAPIYEIDTSKGAAKRTDNIIKYVAVSRKVILSTPIAETGITIPFLKYCIDTGWSLSPEFNPDFGATVLLNKNVTKSMAQQRKGRVGRLAQGEWYPCYTESTFNLLPEDIESKYITENISTVLLNIIVNETKANFIEINLDDYADREDIFRKHALRPSWYKMVYKKTIDFATLDFFTSPSAGGLCYSLERLHTLGLIDFNYRPTILGFLINQMRKIEIEPARMIFAGYSHNAHVLDLITMAAFLQVERRNVCGKSYRMRNPADLSDESAKFYNRVFIADEFIDSIFLWNEFMVEVHRIETMIIMPEDKTKKFSINYIKDWCEANDVSYDNMLYVVSVRDEIIEGLISIGVDPYYNGLMLEQGTYNLTDIFKRSLEDGIEEIKKLKKCILDGYRGNLARWNPVANTYEMIHRPAKVRVKSPLVSEIAAEQQRPQIVALSNLILQSDFGGVTYSFSNAGSVSVLDGFIDLDIHFLKK